jgi:exodeoxyribonuclease-3
MPARRSKAPIRILSWNVNGLRACAKKGFGDWLEGSGAEIVGIQEVRAERDQIPAELSQPKDWHASFSAAERKGYSGVGLFARRAPNRIDTTLDEARFDSEGRVQIARFGRLAVANIYFPNGNGKDRDNSRVPYKLDFYRRLFERLQRLRRSGARVLVMGDFNTAHREIDLARPKANRATSGFLPERSTAGSMPAGSTPIATSIRHRIATPGGVSALESAPRMSAGGSTMCWPPQRR